MSRRLLGPAVAVTVFTALALWTALRLLGHMSEAVPGTHPGDNVAALWNVWWFAYALAHAASPYETWMLFAPAGVQLSLHTHATTHSLLAWPFTAMVGIVAGHNVAIVCGLALNGICTFILALRLVGAEVPRDRAIVPAALAGVVFSCSAFVQARVLGHINLLHAWVLPLFALALLRLHRQPNLWNGAVLGVAGAVVCYTDYYYAVYAMILALIWAVTRAFAVGIVRRPARFAPLRRVLIILVLVDVIVILLIAMSDGTAVEIGSLRVSARGTRNPLTGFWALLAAWAFCRFPFVLTIRRTTGGARIPWLRLTLSASCVSLVLTAPLLAALMRVIAAGEYTTPRVLWRSSPAGVDVLTLLLGHPLHFLTGRWTTSFYAAMGIDAMEQSVWLGLVALAFLVATRREWARFPLARFCAGVGLFFFVLSLGPFLRAGGFDLALPLPYAVLRYVPVFSNARIPGRAVVIASLSVAILVAYAQAHRRRGSTGGVAIVVLLILETLPSPSSAYILPKVDAVDEATRNSGIRGAVAELPTGLRDGFGEAGHLDHRALVHQLWHERPLVGGFVARLPASVRLRYVETPILASFIDISTPANHEARLSSEAASRAAAAGVPFVIVNRDTFLADRLSREAMESAGFELLRTAGPRELYFARQAGRAER